MRKFYLALITLISLITEIYAQGNLTIIGKNLSKHPAGPTLAIKMQNRGNNNIPLFRRFPITEGTQNIPLTNGESYYSIVAVNGAPHYSRIECYHSGRRVPYVTVDDETEMTIIVSYDEQAGRFSCQISKAEMDPGEPDEAPGNYNQG